jgi:protein-L-isoaspartate(D-aspartate) O-methyltransferase
MKPNPAAGRRLAASTCGSLLAALVVLSSCSAAPARQAPAPDEAHRLARERMVATQIEGRGVHDPRVLDSMRRVPRHLFVPEAVRDSAYHDTPLPIGFGQTISQPYIVALMTALAAPKAGDRALEIGTGSGYQAAVLSPLVKELYTVELVEPLAAQAAERLARLGYANVTARAGDGYGGWPDRAPFDLIVVTAAPERVPPALLEQLAPGGRMVIPVGRQDEEQWLRVIEKGPDGRTRTRDEIPVRFVPMVPKKDGGGPPSGDAACTGLPATAGPA